MKCLKSLVACGLVVLPALFVPVFGAQVASDAASRDASGNAADGSTAHRAGLVQKLVGSSTGFTSVSVPIRFSSGDPPRAFTPRYRQTVTADQPPPTVNKQHSLRQGFGQRQRGDFD